MAALGRLAAGLGGHVSGVLPPIVVQAGGKGVRMRTGSESVPKVLVEVQHVPLLERLLRQLAAEGGQDFYVITGHAAEQVEAHVLAMRDFPAAMNLKFIRERSARGNVGALSELADIGQSVLFAFGDLCTNLSFQALYAVHRERQAAITAASHYEMHRLQLGHLIVEGSRVIEYQEKPEYQFLICSGIMAIEPDVLQLLPKQGVVGMNQMVMLAVEAGLLVTHWTHGADWIDVNTPQLLETANQMRWAVTPNAGN